MTPPIRKTLSIKKSVASLSILPVIPVRQRFCGRLAKWLIPKLVCRCTQQATAWKVSQGG